jgi:hypothetical protein
MKRTTFESLVEKAFYGLEAQYGFKKIEAKLTDHGAAIRYRNTTTELCLNYDLGNPIWLEIIEADHPENKSTLGWLLVERGEQRSPTVSQAFNATGPKDKEIEGILKTIVQQVMDHGADLLKGDFTLLPKLQQRAKRYDAECKRYLAIHNKP